MTKTVLETALNEEMTEHLGYEKHDPPETGSGNICNGTRTKTVLTDTTGPVELDPSRRVRRLCSLNHPAFGGVRL